MDELLDDEWNKILKKATIISFDQLTAHYN